MQLPADKIAHVVMGIAITAVWSIFVPPAAALVICAIAAATKEGYDRNHPAKHTYDGWDAFATLIGGVATLAAVEMWHQVVKGL